MRLSVGAAVTKMRRWLRISDDVLWMMSEVKNGGLKEVYGCDKSSLLLSLVPVFLTPPLVFLYVTVC